MTNKYSELSYFEVNKLVAKELHRYSLRHFVGDMQHGDDVEIFIMDSGKIQHYAFFNILEDDSTVFAVMIDNEINLIKGKNAWFAEDGERLRVVNENPCRAIAECFLLMKDAENKDENKTL